MSKRLRIALVAAALTAAAAPLSAQLAGSEGEKFLKAVREGEGGTVTEMVESPSSRVVNYRGFDGNAAIHLVTRGRQSNWLRFLLARGADPDLPDGKGDTALIIAARSGFADAVSRLIAAKASVDKGNRLGETPLIIAVQARQPAIVKMLLEAGANPDKQDFAAGYSARDYARRDTRSRELLQLIESSRAKQPASAKPGPTRL